MSKLQCGSGRGSLVVKVSDRGWPYHEFEPSTTKDPPLLRWAVFNKKKNMVMSETHSEKRKFEKAGEYSANKKARREVSKKYGKFTEDCIPDGVFPIGDDVFVFASTYYDSVSVHIRRFKKYAAFYENPEVPNSFGGVEALHRSVKGKYSKKDVKHWLSQKDAYTLHKPVRHKFQRNRVFVSDIDRQFQADLVDMQSLAEFNKGYKYLLTCIDLFSKFAWAVPLKDKFGKSVKSGLEIIFKERKPKLLQTDAGYEQNWRRELFIVFEIVQRIPIVYRLKDLQGEEIKGTYYEAELQKVVDSGFYPVENVIKQRKRRGITEYFVKFLGYPEKFNDWVTDIQKAPLLRIVRTKGKDGETISQYYDIPQYLPLVRHSFQTIQSELRLNSGDFIPFERGQIGSGLTHYKGINFQKGYGIGGIFRRLFRAALPFLVKGGKTIGKEVLMTGSRVASDVLSGENFKEAVKTRSRESGKKKISSESY
ncbi:uncharacterized transposon-derived protein F54H12.3 [Trichonephila clavipes]|nr:uncharacterized transposon-derived protein F54H12.3 [Trichonephila clavipes]